MKIGKFWWWFIGVLIGSLVVYYFLTRSEIKPRQDKINELTFKRDSLQNLIDSSRYLILALEIKIDSLDSIIIKKNYYIIKINKKYEELFYYLNSIDVDGQIDWFREYLSKEDSIRQRYIDSSHTDTTQTIQFFIR